MILLLAIMVGSLYAAGLFLLLRRSLMRAVLGVIFLGHAAVLLLFVSGSGLQSRAPLISADQNVLEGVVSDPLPQAFGLTAIVISLGILCFILAIATWLRFYIESDDLDRLGEE